MSKKVERTLEELPDKFIECRRRHDWTWIGDEQIVALRQTIVQHTERYSCSRCGAGKTLTLDTRTGYILKQTGTRDAEYSIGYRVTPAEVRVEAFRRRFS